MKIPYTKKNAENFSENEENKIINNNCCSESNNTRKYYYIWLLLVVVLAVVIMAYSAWSSKIAYPSNKDWQAVFLVNGQVYFGKVTKVSSKTLTLKDIYYLQFVTKPLQTSQSGTNTSGEQQTQQELTLIKLGNELHGPTDSMIINRDQILLTEKLGKNSKVIEAINKYLSEKEASKNK